MDPYLRLTFITGVTKFSKTSIFSELNNLFDITLTGQYVNVCGIGIDDLDKYFANHIRNLESSGRFGEYKNIRQGILAWYDGYSWDGKTRLINPFSLLSFLMQERFYSYWYASGTPTFLIKLIKDKPDSFLALKDLEIGEGVLDNFDIRNKSAVPLLFQAGYLTIAERRQNEWPESYLLRIPNFEVNEAFHLNILSEFPGNEEHATETAYRRIRESLKKGDLGAIQIQLKALFASIPYQLHVEHEAYYHSIFYAITNLLGFETSAEVSTARGRIDAVLELEDRVYVIEFKYKNCQPDAAPEEKTKLYEKALDEAMAQIKGRGYHMKYIGSGKTIQLVAFVFLGRDDIEMNSFEVSN